LTGTAAQFVKLECR